VVLIEAHRLPPSYHAAGLGGPARLWHLAGSD
jgi:hypothetical protein